MIRQFILATVAALSFTFSAFAAVDINKATQAELESVKGIGPSMSTKILDERKKGNFKSWDDVVERVKGVGDGNAAKFSGDGLTVGGASYKSTGAAAAPAVKTAAMKPTEPKATGAKAAEPKASEAKSVKK